MNVAARVSIVVVLLLAGALARGAAGTPAPAGAEPRLHVLYLTEAGFELRPLELGDGEARTLTIDAGSDVVDVIYPVGEGQSGNVAQRSSESYVLTVRRDGDAYSMAVGRSSGPGRGVPPVTLAELGAYEVRVNAIAADGRKAVFVIEGGTRVRREDGARVLDMFRGMVPLGPADVSITTETARRETRQAVHGEAELLYDAGLLFAQARIGDAEPRELIVDFAAGATVLSREALPPGTEVRPVVAVEYSHQGKKESHGRIEGAGGAVEGFLGRAVVPRLTVGGLVFDDVEVGVLAEMPVFGGHATAGILGMDLLTRAPVAAVRYGRGEAGRLRLGAAPRLAGDGVVEIPFRRAGNHLFVDGLAGGAPVTFVFDTGARRSHVHPAVASSAGLTLREDDDPHGTRGLDGHHVGGRKVAESTLELGGATWADVPFVVAELPVYQAIGLADRAGLLGNTFLERFAEIEVDFGAGTLRLR